MFIIIRCKWVIPTLITIYNFNPIFISNSHNYIFQWLGHTSTSKIWWLSKWLSIYGSRYNSISMILYKLLCLGQILTYNFMFHPLWMNDSIVFLKFTSHAINTGQYWCSPTRNLLVISLFQHHYNSTQVFHIYLVWYLLMTCLY